MDADELTSANPAAGTGPDAGALSSADPPVAPSREAATAAARLALDVARAQEGRMAFLARASMALGTSLDSVATAAHVANLAVPEMADLCIIDLAGTQPFRAAALSDAHGGAERIAGVVDGTTPAPGSPQQAALESGRAQIGVITDDGPVPWPDEALESALIRDIDIRAYLVLPLRSRGQILGVVSLLSGRRRGYAADEFATAGEFVARASVAVDNALLYESAVRARAEAETAQQQFQFLVDGLRESEERYRTLFEESRDAIYVTRIDGRFIDANTAALELFGYSRDELMNVNARDLYLDPNARSTFSRVVEEHGSVRDYEVTLRTRTGDRLDCLLSSIVRRAPDGSVIGYQGIIRDITDRKRAERRLRESEHFTRAIISSVRQGIIVYDRELRYQVWNRFMEEITGLSAERVIGTHAVDEFPHLLEQGVEALLRRALAGETVYSQDTPFVIPDTRRSGWVTAVYSPHVSPDGDVIGVVGIVHDITERKRLEEQHLHNAFHDPLTGLPNRALLVDRLERLLRQVDRHPEYVFGVAFLDLDRFKTVNDNFGHMVGDDLLVSIARRLEGCVRAGDTVARLGGDEFAVLLAEVSDVRDATRVAERILVELSVPFRLAGHEVYMDASIGIALSSTGYERPEEILRDADTAMYRAKLDERSRYEIFDRQMHQLVLTTEQTETDLRNALERDEFRLEYQPIISLADGRITGFEALIRWDHPRRGMLAPDDFLPFAEDNGLIVHIGWWVLEHATTQMAEWLRRFPDQTDLTMSVNLSAAQFQQPELVERIDAILARAGIPPSALKLEITESVLGDDDRRFTAAIAALRQRGVRLCIDDFGTGTSSLGHLHTFPVDTLKIDRSFVRQIGFSGNSARLVETIVALSHTLGMASVAHGVETREQLEFLRQLGPEFAQGFLFSAPRSSADIVALLEQNPAAPAR
ncbi:MAG TPA: EAL domain-containing protein [Longimicrobiales bacterium]|nr:EAL domain-containing protein [Longimicrobiales bacterium]